MVERPAVRWYRRLLAGGCVLALCVIMLGAYVRLSDAGLGCPDWPGCYGHLGVPKHEDAVAAANAKFPERPVEAAKAWKEMVHRYLASALGLLILAILALAIRNRADPRQPIMLPALLAALVIFQGILGMWTVTLQLKPVVVMAHLLGGFATLALLWWLTLSASRAPRAYSSRPSGFGAFAMLGIVLLLVQIALGGWTSSNYAALACPDFPTCQAEWWPEMDFREAFVLWRGLGVNYEFGVLDSPARTAIHMAHRLGALIVGGYLLVLSLAIIRSDLEVALRRAALVVLLALGTQIGLGIANILLQLPLPIAVLHNGMAVLLLLAMLALIYRLHARNKLLA